MKEQKDTQLRWFRYCAEDAKTAQAELDELAEQGWELKEIGIFCATFQRKERPRRCWVEPSRWKSIRRKEEAAKDDYLALCAEAGWELLEETSGLFYFQAQQGREPVPLQTDESVEWESVWKKSLSEQAWNMLGLGGYWLGYSAACFRRDLPRVWELFLSNSLMAVQLLLLMLLGIELFLGGRILRCRIRCRQAVEAGEPFPIPRRGTARFRGGMPLVYTLFIGAILLIMLGSVGEKHQRFLEQEAGYSEHTRSVLAESFTFRRFGGAGDLWVESYDCKTSWLAGIICDDLRAIEADENRLHRYNHGHGPTELSEVRLDWDQAWTYCYGDGAGIIFRQRNRVVRMEGERLEQSDPTAVSALLEELEKAACTGEASVVA